VTNAWARQRIASEFAALESPALITRVLSFRGVLNDVLVFLIPCMINGAMLIYFMTGFRSDFSARNGVGTSSGALPCVPIPCEGRSVVPKARNGVGRWVTISAC
jgi:hypothetical protein